MTQGSSDGKQPTYKASMARIYTAKNRYTCAQMKRFPSFMTHMTKQQPQLSLRFRIRKVFFALVAKVCIMRYLRIKVI